MLVNHLEYMPIADIITIFRNHDKEYHDLKLLYENGLCAFVVATKDNVYFDTRIEFSESIEDGMDIDPADRPIFYHFDAWSEEDIAIFNSYILGVAIVLV